MKGYDATNNWVLGFAELMILLAVAGTVGKVVEWTWNEGPRMFRRARKLLAARYARRMA
jgi:hypothetical protein